MYAFIGGRKAALLGLCLWLLPSLASAALVFSAPPRESQAEAVKLFRPIADLLSRVLGEPVVYHHPRSWLHYQRDMRDDRYDIVFDGPHFVSWRIHKFGHRPVVSLPGRLSFVVVTGKDEPRIHELKDLVNRRVCVVSPPNLSALFLLGEFPDPLRQPRLVTAMKGGMKRAYSAYRMGRCDAVVLRDQFYEQAVSDADRQELRIIGRSPAYANQALTVSSRIDAARVEQLRNALTLSHPELRALLQRFAPGSASLLPATAGDYETDYRLLSEHIVGWEMY